MSILVGTAGVDTLTGTSANETLDGGAGADSLLGGLGDDLYIVDNAGDVVVEAAGEGFDTVQTSKTWVATAGSSIERIILTGTASLNATGNLGAMLIEGNSAINTLDDGGGADTLKALAGNDTYVVRNAATLVIENAGEGTDLVRTTLASYALTANVENLTFIGAGGFAGTGNALANVITGASGNDTLDGGAGADRLIGGLGNDVYYVDSASDAIVEAAGEGYDTQITTLASAIAATNVEALVYSGTAAFTGYANAAGTLVTGNVGADKLTGGAGADTLDGGLGADTLTGAGGDDVFIVDNVGDRVTESANGGFDTVRTALASYTLAAEVEALVYTGAGTFVGTGNTLANKITGGASADSLVGGAGDDTLDGGLGGDTLVGGAGNDVFLVDSVSDVVVEAAGGGSDLVRTTLTTYSLAAEVEAVTYLGSGAFTGTGNTLANVLTGGAAADRLLGLDGADTLIGGAGNDTLEGGLGDDVAVYAGARARYVVTPDGVGGFYVHDTQVPGGDGNDRLIGVERLQFSDGLVAIADAATGALLQGSSSADTLIGGSAADEFRGLGGDDVIQGGAGDDLSVYSGARADYAVYSDSSGGFYVIDRRVGAANEGRDYLTSVEYLQFSDSTFGPATTATGLLLLSAGAADGLMGTAGEDLLIGAGGDDTLNGGDGADIAAYAGEASRYIVYSDGVGGYYVDDQTGVEGRDHLISIETLQFADQSGQIETYVQGLILVGGPLADVLVGSSGDDVLVGGLGADTLQGGDGLDTAIYSGAAARYTV